MDENLKKLMNLSLAAGEKRISQETDYLHLKYHSLDEVNQTIPLLENFLFTLSLFKTRSTENVTRAKGFLEKLLYFQIADGEFPVYLHEYPECKDRYLSISLLAPLYWIYHGFHQILGSTLKGRLEKALTLLLDYSLKILIDKNPPYYMRMRLGSAAYAIGKLLGSEDYVKTGEAMLAEFEKETDNWHYQRHLGDLIIAAQMADPKFSQKFMNHLCKMWNTVLSCYIGPRIEEYQSGFEPEVTLYDLFMGYLTKKFSKRALKESPVHLHAVLIQECDLIVDEKLGSYDFTFTESNAQEKCTSQKGFTPYKLVFGSSERLHSLALEGVNCQKIDFKADANKHEFLFFLDAVPELEDKEKSREIAFYFDLFDRTEFRVEGIKATTFQLGEQVEVLMDGFKFDLKFEIVEGSGQFMGHFMRGNRPSQIANKGKDRFAAFDNQIFLRTIRRDEGCILKATLHFSVA